jgi:hypothetical protein
MSVIPALCTPEVKAEFQASLNYIDGETLLRKKIRTKSWVLVAHDCNCSYYLRGTAQKDQGSKPSQIISFRDPISKIPNTQKIRAGGVPQVESTCLASMKH